MCFIARSSEVDLRTDANTLPNAPSPSLEWFSYFWSSLPDVWMIKLQRERGSMFMGILD